MGVGIAFLMVFVWGAALIQWPMATLFATTIIGAGVWALAKWV